jgi:hypothetical protein
MPLIDLKAVRSQIPMQQVLGLLQFFPASHAGLRLRGPCPIHDSEPHGRSFSVHLSRRRYRCLVCHSAGSQLDLWAAVHGLSLPAAADLYRRFGHPIPWLSAS